MKLKKILLSIAFSFSFMFLVIGFAATTEKMDVEAEVELDMQDGVFIYDASVSKGMGSISGYVETILSSNITLETNNNATVEQTIKVYNNTSEVYGYNAYAYVVGENTYSNENIVITVEYINPETNQREAMLRRTEVAAHGTLEFYAVFSYKDNKYNATNGAQLMSTIDYEFFPLDELPENEEDSAAQDAINKFAEILNNDITYAQLLGIMDGSGDFWNGKHGNEQSYTGNVDGASDVEIEVIEELFEGSIKVIINGTEIYVTCLIKRENLDGNTSTGMTYEQDNYFSKRTIPGCEMTIYMTANSLTSAGSYAVVYAQVFTTLDGGDNWFQIGSTWEGTARVVSYSGANGTGSFNTETWKSPAQSYVNEYGQTVTGSTMGALIDRWIDLNPNYTNPS